jgi:prepilin-type N-terminal cleavage/methylation domain-containing protein
MNKRTNRGFTLIELLVVIIIISILLALLLPAVARAMCNARAGKAGALVRQIETGAEQYEKEQNIYPVGDGTGSTAAYAVLTAPGPRGLPYLQKNKDNRLFFVNTVDNVQEIRYRNNAQNPVPNTGIEPVRNTNRVDIWCGTCDELRSPPIDNTWVIGQPDGINNWR